jgi:hypothetical protein
MGNGDFKLASFSAELRVHYANLHGDWLSFTIIDRCPVPLIIGTPGLTQLRMDIMFSAGVIATPRGRLPFDLAPKPHVAGQSLCASTTIRIPGGTSVFVLVEVHSIPEGVYLLESHALCSDTALKGLMTISPKQRQFAFKNSVEES